MKICVVSLTCVQLNDKYIKQYNIIKTNNNNGKK